MEQKEELSGQVCPVCQTKNLTLREAEDDIPYFGKAYIFSMTCTSCKFHKSDLESAEPRDPTRYTIEISGPEDNTIRIVKSSQATVKIPYITTIEPGIASNGYITNVEGLISRVKQQLESVRDDAEDPEDQKKAKNMLKKLSRTLYGSEKLKIIIEDPTGNSAIISDKAVVEKYKPK